MKPKKALGQNFLQHAATARRIVLASEISKKDTVLEIGPGTGQLTRELLAAAKKVIALEADAELIPVLTETFTQEIKEKRLELIHQDVRTFDTTSFQGTYHLVANIPYYITGEIIRAFLEAKHKPNTMTLLVQKEVAERIARDKRESLLSISVKTYGTPQYRFTVSKGSFFPIPKVDSAVLSITNIHSPFKTTREEERFFTVLKTGFAHKRKMLFSNLSALATKEKLTTVFSATGLDMKTRAETVPLSAWHELAKALKS